MAHSISPWIDAVKLISPDGRFYAEIYPAMEMGMGAPTCGTLEVVRVIGFSPHVLSLEDCNPSLVWATDSSAIAVPRWTSNRRQNLAIVLVPSGRVIVLPEEFRVLELESFDNGIVCGVDSSIHMPRPIKMNVAEWMR